MTAGDIRVALVLGCAAFVAVPSQAATLHVNPDGTGDYPTIAAAMDAAVSGDVIELADGIYTGGGNRDLWLVEKPLNLRSESGDPERCIIDCQGTPAEPHRFLSTVDGLPPGSWVIGITCRNGFAPATEPEPNSGGAIYIASETELGVSNCILRACHATRGGAIACFEISATSFDHCIIADNDADYGGGVFTRFAILSMTSCTLSGNVATIEGGAIQANDHDVDLYDCTLVDNSAPTGSGIVSDSAWMRLTRSLIAAGRRGAAVVCRGTTGEVYLECCDIFGNAGGDWVGCVESRLGQYGNIAADPEFCSTTPALDWKWTLQSDSPCAAASCGPIGAWPAGCGVEAAAPASWGAIRLRYRTGRR